MLLNCGIGADTWESLGLQGDPTRPSKGDLVLCVHWRDWCWSWNSNTLATWCGVLTHLRRPWYWEKLRAGREEHNRGDGWMASPTQWTWVLVDSGSWWWTRRPGVLWFMGLQRVRHCWATELNWTVVKESTCPLQKMQEMQLQFLGWKDSLEKEMATHSSILTWEIPWTVEPGRLQSMGSQRIGHNWAQHSKQRRNLSNFSGLSPEDAKDGNVKMHTY